MIHLRLTGTAWNELRSHLLQNDVEQVAIAFALPLQKVHVASDPALGESRVYHALRVVETYHCNEADFTYQSAFHVALTGETQARLIKRAWDLGAAFVELHSHVKNDSMNAAPLAAAFSPSDLSGFEEFVPHVRWRLRGAPYVAIVVTESEFDALLWDVGSNKPTALTAIEVDGEAIAPSGRTLRMLLGDVRFNHSHRTGGQADVQ